MIINELIGLFVIFLAVAIYVLNYELKMALLEKVIDINQIPLTLILIGIALNSAVKREKI
jgi:hypothetical protein